MPKKKVAFISGVGGTGKTAIIYHFIENPINGFTFYDFDRGKYKIPAYDSPSLEWRTKMNDWWLKVAHNEYEVKGNITVIGGLCLYPRQVYELPNAKYFNKEDIMFAHLICDQDVREKRLIDRGSVGHWKEVPAWYDEFENEMKKGAAYEIDTTDLNVEATALKIKQWLQDVVDSK